MLLLYCKHQYYDLAADVLAENTYLHQNCLSPVRERVHNSSAQCDRGLQELYEYLEATILTQSSPEEAFRKFDQVLIRSHLVVSNDLLCDSSQLANKHIEVLRKLTKKIQDARIARDNDLIKNALKEYDEALERYIPVLMAQAKIYWVRISAVLATRLLSLCLTKQDIENYAMVEKIFKQSAEFCSEHDTWKLNVAHVFFMQVRFALRFSVAC